MLARVLPSYLAQSHMSEIIIVDDGSSRCVEASLAEAGVTDERVRVIRHTRSLGSCAARNTGITAAKCPWTFFGEDDLILSDGHLAALHNARVELGADLICGRLVQQEGDESMEAASHRVLANPQGLIHKALILVSTASIREPVELPFAHAIFMTQTCMLRDFLFSTRIGGPSFQREDLELQLTLREAGYRLFATPNAVAFHLAKKNSSGSGTRLRRSIAIDIASAIINSWQVIEEHHATIAPFFGKPSKEQMLRRVAFWTTMFEAKRWARERFPAFDKVVSLLRGA